MSYNEDARIVPIEVVMEILRQDPRAADLEMPLNYARVQLLTGAGYQKALFAAHDRSYVHYGEMSLDYPLCLDFADFARDDVKKYLLKQGVAVRPGFGTLEYTMNAVYDSGPWAGEHKRHAINCGVTADGRRLFVESQNDLWLPEPNDCLTMDYFRL